MGERIQLLAAAVGAALGACFESNRVAIRTTWTLLEWQFAQFLVEVPPRLVTPILYMVDPVHGKATSGSERLPTA